MRVWIVYFILALRSISYKTARDGTLRLETNYENDITIEHEKRYDSLSCILLIKIIKKLWVLQGSLFMTKMMTKNSRPVSWGLLYRVSIYWFDWGVLVSANRRKVLFLVLGFLFPCCQNKKLERTLMAEIKQIQLWIWALQIICIKHLPPKNRIYVKWF